MTNRKRGNGPHHCVTYLEDLCPADSGGEVFRSFLTVQSGGNGHRSIGKGQRRGRGGIGGNWESGKQRPLKFLALKEGGYGMGRYGMRLWLWYLVEDLD